LPHLTTPLPPRRSSDLSPRAPPPGETVRPAGPPRPTPAGRRSTTLRARGGATTPWTPTPHAGTVRTRPVLRPGARRRSAPPGRRSEEHTSELQSRSDLV